jgi:RNA polymerase sigma factor (TIGR02999 family)
MPPQSAPALNCRATGLPIHEPAQEFEIPDIDIKIEAAALPPVEIHATILSVSDVTRILEALAIGGRASADELLPLVYQDLRKLAALKMTGQAPGHTLQPTALVHEAWLRLAGNEPGRFAGRAHFYAAAAEAMRHILIDSARRKRAARHGGGQVRMDIEAVEIASLADDDELLAVHDVLEKLAAEDPQKAELTKLHYFVGLTFEEAADVLGISVATAKRHWAYARAFLYEEIRANKTK